MRSTKVDVGTHLDMSAWRKSSNCSSNKPSTSAHKDETNGFVK